MRKSVFLLSSLVVLATGAGCSYDASKLRAGVDADDLGQQTSSGPVETATGSTAPVGVGGVAGTGGGTDGSVPGVGAGTGPGPEAGRDGSIGPTGTGGISGSAGATTRASGSTLGTVGAPTITSSGGVAGMGGVAALGTGGSRAASGGTAAGIDASVGGAGGASDSPGKGGPHAEGGTSDPGKGPHADAATGSDGGDLADVAIDGGGTDGAVTCSPRQPDFGKSCGKCGGTITCGGNCSVPTPTNYGAICVSLCLCQLTGTIDCQGNCAVKNCNC